MSMEAVEELKHRKARFGAALEAAIEAAPDDAARDALRAKLPAAPLGRPAKKKMKDEEEKIKKAAEVRSAS